MMRRGGIALPLHFLSRAGAAPVLLHASPLRGRVWWLYGSASKRTMHSAIKAIEPAGNLRIITVPILSDNYSLLSKSAAYLLIDKESGSAAAVDPAEPEIILQVAKSEGVDLKAILTTHHHWDHAGGNEAIVAAVPNIEVYGGDPRITNVTEKVGHGNKFTLGSLHLKVLFTPCHTSGHVLYLATGNDKQSKVLFTGDTMFIGGCGRFFEGSAWDMHHALCEIIGNLPPSTLVFCGHEYTVNNLKFALSVEPDNEHMKRKLEWAMQQRDQSPPSPTVPSTIGEELEHNIFMRVREPAVWKSLLLDDPKPAEVMAVLRKMKDSW